MKFACEKCEAKYKIADEKVKGRTLRMPCRRCGAEIIIRGKELSVAPPPAQAPARAVMPAPGLGPLPAAPVVSEPPDETTTIFNPKSLLEGLPALTPPIPVATTPADDAMWHVSINDVPVGPMSVKELSKKMELGSVNEYSLVWREDFDEWRPLATTPELFSLLQRQRSMGPPPASMPAGGQGLFPSQPPPPMATAGSGSNPGNPGGSMIPYQAGPGSVHPSFHGYSMPVGAPPTGSFPVYPSIAGMPHYSIPGVPGVVQEPRRTPWLLMLLVFFFGVIAMAALASAFFLYQEKAATSAPIAQPMAPAPAPTPAPAPAPVPAQPAEPAEEADTGEMVFELDDGETKTKAAEAAEKKAAAAEAAKAELAAAKAAAAEAAKAAAEKKAAEAAEKKAARAAAAKAAAERAAAKKAAAAEAAAARRARRRAASKRRTTSKTSNSSGLSESDQALLSKFGNDDGAGAAKIDVGGSGGSGKSRKPLDATALKTTVAKGKRGLVRCYERAVRGLDAVPVVRMDVTLTVSPSGRVSTVDAQGSGPGGLKECIETSVKRWTFPASSGSTTTRFPLVFAERG